MLVSPTCALSAKYSISRSSTPATNFSNTSTENDALSPAAVRLSNSVASLRRNASLPVRTGASRAVVQLGAYKSSDRVAVAWAKVTGKHANLRAYTPVSARFAGAKGTVYRLSVKGFASEREAMKLCYSLKRAGGSCFVRAVSGDTPVQFAAR